MSPTEKFACDYHRQFGGHQRVNRNGFSDAHLNLLYYLVVGGRQFSVRDIWDYEPGIRWIRDNFDFIKIASFAGLEG
jgi:hypothetical protein